MKRKTKTTWIRKALQGVAFWIGHRQSLYSDYPLTEAAIVTEICNLIHGNLKDNYRLLREVTFAKFLKEKRPEDELSELARVDLIVAERVETDGKHKLLPSYVIEVKRLPAEKAKINLDFRRLAAVKAAKPESRTLLFAISEGERPMDFVANDGTLRKEPVSIPQTDAFYRVQRCYTAASEFNSPESAHYALMIEVFLHKKKRSKNLGTPT